MELLLIHKVDENRRGITELLFYVELITQAISFSRVICYEFRKI